MKIAILGNMNNNGFAIMRYFRDLGADADLLLYANDGVGSCTHFRPENDTWYMDKWSPYIRQTRIYNWTTSVVPDLRQRRWPPSTRSLLKELSGYDEYIASGIAPAVFDRIGLRLSLFFPYCIGVEWFDDPDFKRARERAVLSKFLLERLRDRQRKGILAARECINPDMGFTAETLKRVGRSFRSMPAPMVYNREDLIAINVPKWISTAVSSVPVDHLKVFHSARLKWVHDPKMSEADWFLESKNNHYLIHGFANFLKGEGRGKGTLFIVEYGTDAAATKKLCVDLGISECVRWLPLMSRKEIMLFLGLCDVGVGQFYKKPGMIWAGTGWECLAAGRPLLQAFNFTQAEFKKAFGYEAPPLLDAQSPGDVERHLVSLHHSPGMRYEIGASSKRWFDANNGISLAKAWLGLATGQNGAKPSGFAKDEPALLDSAAA
jgi:hypothetical protein